MKIDHEQIVRLLEKKTIPFLLLVYQSLYVSGKLAKQLTEATELL